jgi:hypothetical protein
MSFLFLCIIEDVDAHMIFEPWSDFMEFITHSFIYVNIERMPKKLLSWLFNDIHRGCHRI